MLTGDNTDKIEVGLGTNKIIGEDNFGGNMRNYGRQNSRGEYRSNGYRNDSYDRSKEQVERGVVFQKLWLQS